MCMYMATNTESFLVLYKELETLCEQILYLYIIQVPFCVNICRKLHTPSSHTVKHFKIVCRNQL